MSTDERYEGWANRETWAVALHINNDQGWQESVHEALREADVTQWNEQPNGGMANYRAGEIIRDNVEDTLEYLGSTVVNSDYVSDRGKAFDTYRLFLSDVGSLWRVDWPELGAAFLEDIAEGDA